MISVISAMQVLSDMIMVCYVIKLICAFGISEYGSAKRRLAAAAVTALMSVIVLETKESVSFAVYLIMVLTAFRIVFGTLKLSYVYVFMLSDSVTSLLSSCIFVMINAFIPSVRSDVKILILLFFRISMLITAAALDHSGKVRRLHFTIKIIPRHVFILTVLSIMFISFLAENNSFTVENILKRLINTLLIALLTVSLVIMIFSLLMNVVAKKHFSDDNELLRHQADIQLRHYKRLEKLNNDINSFRHDYTNHMRSVLSLLEMKQYRDAEEYVRKLAEKCAGRSISFQTGNLLADAILTDKSDICRDYAEIAFYGFIPTDIDNADLCVILSNSLDNASEACAACGGNSLIEVFAQVRQGYFVLTVRNPTADGRTYSGIPETTKPDALNHGFGLGNIESAVLNHGGRINVSCKNNVFELSLTFKL